MKQALTKVVNELYHYSNGVKKEGRCSNLSGDCSGLRGNCSGLSGDCSGLRGNCSGLRGNLDDCDISQKEREKGVDITKLVKKVKP